MPFMIFTQFLEYLEQKLVVLKKYLFFYLILLFVSIGIFSSCRKNLLPNRSQRPLRLNFAYMPFSLDPRKVTEPLTTTFNQMLYEGLTYLEPNGQVSLALASQVSISKDEKTYRFQLKKSYWSDGTSVTAHDFEGAWKGALNPQFPSKSAHLFYPIKNAKEAKQGLASLDEVGVKALSDDVLIVELAYPTPYFLELTSYCTYFPVPPAYQQSTQLPKPHCLISNGPFVLHRWTDHEIQLKKNAYFWDHRSVHINQVEISMISDESTAMELFSHHKIDWFGGMISPIPPQMIFHLAQKGKVKTQSIAGTTFCLFNIERFPFHNLNMRKAFAYAIDRQSLIHHITQTPDVVATGLIPAPLKKEPQAIFFPIDQQGLARSYLKKGLAELNLKKDDLPLITYHYFQSTLNQKLALALQSQWKDILDIQVAIHGLQIQNHFCLLRKRNFQIAHLSWIAQYLDPMNFLERLTSSYSTRNYAGWHSCAFDDLLQKSYHIQGEKRKKLLHQAEKLVLEELPLAPFYHYQLVYLQNPGLKQVEISPLGNPQFRHAYFDSKIDLLPTN